jgi:hypothetical protein
MKENHSHLTDRQLLLELHKSFLAINAGNEKIIALLKKQSPKTFYDLQELSEQFHITKRTIRNSWLNKGLPYFKIGSRIFVNQSSLKKFIESNSIVTSKKQI